MERFRLRVRHEPRRGHIWELHLFPEHPRRQRRLFREGLEELPSEVVLYWFTLCFYGYRQAAGRAALRTLFTHEEPEETSEDHPSANRKRKRQPESGPNLFSLSNGEQRARVH